MSLSELFPDVDFSENGGRFSGAFYVGKMMGDGLNIDSLAEQASSGSPMNDFFFKFLYHFMRTYGNFFVYYDKGMSDIDLSVSRRSDISNVTRKLEDNLNLEFNAEYFQHQQMLGYKFYSDDWKKINGNSYSKILRLDVIRTDNVVKNYGRFSDILAKENLLIMKSYVNV